MRVKGRRARGCALQGVRESEGRHDDNTDQYHMVRVRLAPRPCLWDIGRPQRACGQARRVGYEKVRSARAACQAICCHAHAYDWFKQGAAAAGWHHCPRRPAPPGKEACEQLSCGSDTERADCELYGCQQSCLVGALDSVTLACCGQAGSSEGYDKPAEFVQSSASGGCSAGPAPVQLSSRVVQNRAHARKGWGRQDRGGRF